MTIKEVEARSGIGRANIRYYEQAGLLQPQRRENNRPRAPRQPRPAAVSPGRPGNYEWQSRRIEGGSFEDMMSRFKQSSDEKMSDLKRAVEGKRGGFSRHGNSRG